MNADNMEENALARFAKKPFDPYKKYSEFSPVDGVVEEILGRLGCLRRNQIVVDVGKTEEDILPNTFKLLRDHDMRVVHISDYGEGTKDIEKEFKNFVVAVNVFGEHVDDIMKKLSVPAEFALLCLDSSVVETEFKPNVIVSTIDVEVDPEIDRYGGFKSTVEFWNDKNYTLVDHGGKYLVFVRSYLVFNIGVKPVVTRNPSMLFDWKAHENAL